MLRVPRPRPTRGTGPAEKVLGRPAIWPVRSPGGVLAGPVRSSGRPPWPPSGGPHPRQGPAGAHLSSAVPPPESPPGVRGGEVCPNLLQRPRSHRSAGRESLIFRASARRRSRPGAPLQQIRTRPRPGPPRSSPTRPTRLSIPVLRRGEGPPCAAATDRSGEWRPGRIVPERTSHRSHKNRGIVRKSPSTSGVLARMILPERQNRAREPDETGWGRRPGAIGRGRGPTMTGGADNRGRRAGPWGAGRGRRSRAGVRRYQR